jgi:palmitoyl-protein thioesterase
MRSLACIAAVAAIFAAAVSAKNWGATERRSRSGPLAKFEEVKHYQAPVIDTTNTPVLGSANATYRPVVLMHGLGDAGSNPGMQSLATSIETAYPGAYAVAVDVADGLWSFITSLQEQVDQFASTVRADPKLAGGFNAVGLSQGGLVVRGYIEQYNNPPVHNFVSICGVQGGEYNCPLEIQILPFVCEIFAADPYNFIFNGSLPISFSDYWVTYDNESMYLAHNDFLPELNNQVPHGNSSIYKTRWSSLNKLALIAATEDTVVYPWQAEQFGGYAWNTQNATIFNFTESDQYTQNLLGMADMYAAGQIDFASFQGDHLRFNDSYWNQVCDHHYGFSCICMYVFVNVFTCVCCYCRSCCRISITNFHLSFQDCTTPQEQQQHFFSFTISSWCTLGTAANLIPRPAKGFAVEILETCNVSMSIRR